MPTICYKPKKFAASSLAIIDQANVIIAEYRAQGYDLTLRQIYYQFVSRDMMANKQTEYKRLGSIINDGRLAGLIDWAAIEDRTRNLQSQPNWENPEKLVEACAEQFRIDKWRTQPKRVEVWVEKEALAGVFERVCHEHDLAFFACRGYVSQSEMWRAAQRFQEYKRDGQEVVVLHFGDHDPSGIDMTRDIADRLDLLGAWAARVDRIALNMSQVEQYNPPPNPAKLTDSRAHDYVQQFGDESWELDALTPQVLADLVTDRVSEHRDDALWAEAEEIEQRGRDLLLEVSAQWDDITENLS